MPILLISGLLAVSLFSNGHLWWDDFASYLLQARAILQGSMNDFVQENGRAIAQSTYPVGPAAYPWGYPLLVSPLAAFFWGKLVAFKAINTLAFSAFLAVFFLLARSRFDLPRSAALTSLLAFSPPLLLAQDLIQADFVFLFLTTLAMLLLEKPAPSRWVLGFLIFLATFFRTTGILLLGVLFIVDMIQWRAQPQLSYRALASPYLVFGLLYLCSRLIFPSGEASYFSHYDQFFTIPRLLDNALFYLALPAWLFRDLPGGGVIFGLLAICFLWGLLRHWRAELPWLVFSLVTLAALISWPERQGLRFIYPLLPFYLFISLRGMDDLLMRFLMKDSHEIVLVGTLRIPSDLISRLPSLLFGALALLSLVITFQATSGALLTRQEINGPFDEYSREMFAFVREQTPAHSVIVFFKPRAMRLLGERYSILLDRCERLHEGDYIVLHQKQADNGQVDPEKISACKLNLEQVFANRRFKVYQVLRK